MADGAGYYTEKYKQAEREYQSVSSKVKRFAWYRFLAFAALFVPVSVSGASWGVLGISLFLVIFFFFLIKLNVRLEKQKNRLAVLMKIIKDEQLALKHSFLHFQNGEKFLDTEHFFAYDLDLFGDGSLFQFINRTSTVDGRRKLAGCFVNPSKDKKFIEQRQQAIKELAQDPDWRLQFRTTGSLFEETEGLNREVRSWSGMELMLNRPEIVKWMVWLAPLVSTAGLIPVLATGNYTFLLLVAFIQFLLMYLFWKRINQYFVFFGRKSGVLEKYMQLMEVVEEREFHSDYLLTLQQEVRQPSASQVFRQLKRLVKEFEYRQNILVGVILNGLFLWDIRCVYKLWQWHNDHREDLAEWLEVVAETDALVSLSNFAGNHPDFIWPSISDGDFLLRAKGMGHPLLKAGKRVCNDIEIKDWSKVVVVTGANMAGKSTFLRTVGINLVLARLGAPVCAEEMCVTPTDIYTNMRTTDSLLKDESYFFAELKRIKGVLDRLEKGERIFVILDEMLKGTNSVDKLNGSKELVKKLIELEAVALIATHDLKLSEMETLYPANIENKCFEIRIESGEMIFDYKLSEGVTQTMNATFLMRKMGII